MATKQPIVVPPRVPGVVQTPRDEFNWGAWFTSFVLLFVVCGVISVFIAINLFPAGLPFLPTFSWADVMVSFLAGAVIPSIFLLAYALRNLDAYVDKLRLVLEQVVAILNRSNP